ncbi:hypothetical protein M8J77_001782 [Diaphorina citri]|nr:hypothetical protein M8J77_001782 [Diaphorina citri]
MPPDEFNLCVTNMARTAFPYHIQGDPTRGVPPLDPLPVIRLDLEIRNPPLKVTVLDGVMVGLKDLDIQASRTDLKTEYSEYDLKIPRLNLLGNYQADGFFLFMAVNDKGPINITIVDLDLTVTIKFSKKVKKDKVLHMKLKDVSFKVNAIGRAYYYMGNLFQGALPLLNDQFNQALNADWKAVTNEALPSLSKAFSKMFKSVVGRIMQPYPFNALFPPDGSTS